MRPLASRYSAAIHAADLHLIRYGSLRPDNMTELDFLILRSTRLGFRMHVEHLRSWHWDDPEIPTNWLRYSAHLNT